MGCDLLAGAWVVIGPCPLQPQWNIQLEFYKKEKCVMCFTDIVSFIKSCQNLSHGDKLTGISKVILVEMPKALSFDVIPHM